MFELDEYLDDHFAEQIIAQAEDLCSEYNVQITEDKSDVIKAEVNVPNEQHVEIGYQNGKITYQNCSCQTENCVHIALLLLYYFEYRFDLFPDDDKEVYEEKIKTILNKATKAELENLILEIAGLQSGIERYIHDYFITPEQNDLQAYWQHEVNRYFGQYQDDFIGLEDEGLYRIPAYFSEKIEQLYNKGENRKLSHLLIALIDRLHTEKIEVYDIYEELEELEVEIFEKLEKVLDKKLYTKTEYNEIFDHVLSLLDKTEIYDFDYGYILLEIIAKNIDDNIKYQKFEARLDKEIRSSSECGATMYTFEFSREVLLVAKENYAKDEEILEFMHENIEVPSIRIKLSELKIREQSFDEAKAIASDGLSIAKACENEDEIETFEKLLLDIAIEEENENDIFERTYHILMHHQFEKRYYQLLKVYAPEEEWPTIRDQIIERLIEQSYGEPHLFIKKILIEEKMYAALLDYLEQLGKDFSELDKHEHFFPEEYKARLIQAYLNRLRTFVDSHTTRNHYRTAIRYIEKVQFMGAEKEAKQLVLELRSKYPDRKAMQEEFKDLDDPTPDLFSSAPDA